MLRHFAVRTLTEVEADAVVSGMALGWDTAIAHAAVHLNIPLIAAIPFIGQEEAWPRESQTEYNCLLNAAKHVEVITAGGYTPQAMQLRNKWMVDHCGQLLVLWDGSAGGTGNCVRYADKRTESVQQVRLWAEWKKFLQNSVDLARKAE